MSQKTQLSLQTSNFHTTCTWIPRVWISNYCILMLKILRNLMLKILCNLMLKILCNAVGPTRINTSFFSYSLHFVWLQPFSQGVTAFTSLVAFTDVARKRIVMLKMGAHYICIPWLYQPYCLNILRPVWTAGNTKPTLSKPNTGSLWAPSNMRRAPQKHKTFILGQWQCLLISQAHQIEWPLPKTTSNRTPPHLITVTHVLKHYTYGLQ